MDAARPQQRVKESKTGVSAGVCCPARVRLERIIGRDFAQQLLAALTPPQGRRGSSPP